MNKKEIASYIDHTLLAPTATVNQIIQLCQEADRCGFASVCVNPIYVGVAATQLKESETKVCTVVGFPLGATQSTVKAMEARTAVRNGADEVDMVIDIGAAKDGRFSEVSKDIACVVRASKNMGKRMNKNVIVKVILETCYLSDYEIQTCCLCAKNAGADFVKTSTGFGTPKDINGNSIANGASVHHVQLMRSTVGPEMGVKASGGIRTSRLAAELIEAGASRLGTSSGVGILQTWDESVEIKNAY